MVRVNGSMVPPFGQAGKDGQSQSTSEPTIKYGTPDSKGGEIEKGESLRAKDKQEGQTKKNEDLGKRYGDNRSLSIEKGDCKATIYMHVSLESLGNCTRDQMQATKEKMEEAAKKWNQKLDCAAKDGKDIDPESEGCQIELKLVWYDSGTKGEYIPIQVDCTKDAKHDGSTRSGVGKEGAFIKVVAPDMNGDAAAQGDQSEGYYGHELGHNLYGSDPKKAFEGEPHSSSSGSFMRAEKNIRGDEEPTQDDLSELNKELGLCDLEKCCKYKKKAKSHMYGPVDADQIISVLDKSGLTYFGSVVEVSVGASSQMHGGGLILIRPDAVATKCTCSGGTSSSKARLGRTADRNLVIRSPL